MRRWNRWVGLVIGAGFLIAGVAAVVFVDFSPTPPPPENVVRPVKLAIVRDADSTQQRRFRGQVVPGRTVDLAFQVGGQIAEADLSLGRQVDAGDVLATLDMTPLDQQIAVLQPTVRQTREKLEQARTMAEQGVATARELADAQAAYDQAAAQLRIAQQAKEDATLTAPFRALVVQRFTERFENVQAGEPVVRLQDISSVDIRVELPESVVARHRGDRSGQAQARFAAVPGQSFAVTVKEASAEADPTTGGYPVTFTMPPPEGATLLPGMGATVVLVPPAGDGSGAVAVPVEAVFVDDTRGRCVWRLAEQGEMLVAAKVPVTVSQLVGEVAIVTEGLQPGWRVATAGVHFLREGQVVRPMEQKR